MRHTATRALFAHWNEIRLGTAVPDRNDIDPALIGPLLQDVFILGLDPVNGRWTYRVAGTRLTSFARRELREEPFERWWRPDDRQDVKRLLSGIAEDGAPGLGGVAGNAPDHSIHDFELVLLPLRHGGRTVTRMLGGLFPSPAVARHIGLAIDDIGLTSVRTLLRSNAENPMFGAKPADLGTVLDRRRAFRVIQGGARQWAGDP
jgi:hypothetical protein